MRIVWSLLAITACLAMNLFSMWTVGDYDNAWLFLGYVPAYWLMLTQPARERRYAIRAMFLDDMNKPATTVVNWKYETPRLSSRNKDNIRAL
jgi:hypothetical protein